MNQNLSPNLTQILVPASTSEVDPSRAVPVQMRGPP